MYFQSPGEKIFNVLIGKKKILENFDIFGKVLSRLLPYDHFVELEIKKGKVYIDVTINSLG